MDHETFGLLFEALVERDLRIYMDFLDGKLYHFRDNVSGDEVDSILEFRDGEYGAVEIKLTSKGNEDAKKSLITFYNNAKIKPKFMCIIVGHYEAVIKDKRYWYIYYSNYFFKTVVKYINPAIIIARGFLFKPSYISSIPHISCYYL